MNKLLKIGAWVALVAYMLLVSGFVSKRHHQRICKQVQVIITDSLSQKFIDADDITNGLRNAGIETLGEPLESINTSRVEKKVMENSLIESCKTYKTVDGTLYIELEQKMPLAKIITAGGNQLYLDKDGGIFNTKTKYSPHIVVVSGHIKIPFSVTGCKSIFDLQYREKTGELRQLYHLVKYINNHEFWSVQIEQIYRNRNGEYEIVPRIGPHLITLGSLNNFEEKLWKLKVLYDEGFSRVGWNNYLFINLKYKDQIVCTKN